MSAGGPGLHLLLPGSLAAALTPTRPRRRFYCSIGAIFSTEGAGVSRAKLKTASVRHTREYLAGTDAVLSLREL